MYAAEKGHVDVFKLLEEKEANIRNTYEQTALMVAARAGQTEFCKLLINQARQQD